MKKLTTTILLSAAILTTFYSTSNASDFRDDFLNFGGNYNQTTIDLDGAPNSN